MASLQAFVSSSMEELKAERLAVKHALRGAGVEAFVFEEDAGARPVSSRKTYLRAVDESDFFIGLFWRRYGPYTIEEFEHAQSQGKDCLIYEKHVDVEHRDPKLQTFLDDIGHVGGVVTIKRFETVDGLEASVPTDVREYVADTYRGRKRQKQVPRLLVYRADRGDQKYQVRELVSERREQADRHHIIGFVHGRDREMHERFIDVLGEHTLPQLYRHRKDVSVRTYRLNWPRGEITFDRLRAQFDNILRERQAHEIGPRSELADTVNGHRGPILVHTHVFAEDLQQDAREKLALFARYWNEWPSRSRSEPLLAFLCIYYQRIEARRGFLARVFKSGSSQHDVNEPARSALAEATWEEYDRIRVVTIPRLRGVLYGDVDDWAKSESVRKYWPRGESEIVRLVRELYENSDLLIDEDLESGERRIPMQDLADRLETILKRASA